MPVSRAAGHHERTQGCDWRLTAVPWSWESTIRYYRLSTKIGNHTQTIYMHHIRQQVLRSSQVEWQLPWRSISSPITSYSFSTRSNKTCHFMPLCSTTLDRDHPALPRRYRTMKIGISTPHISEPTFQSKSPGTGGLSDHDEVTSHFSVSTGP